MRGFWRRPISRTYEYNLEVGEHYYSPLTSYLETRQGSSRGETPGALTYSERLARKWIYGRRYDSDELKERYTRSASVARGEGFAAAASRSASNLETSSASRSSRAVSEARITASSSLQSRAENTSSISQQRQNLLSASRSSLSHTAQTTSSRQETKYESSKKSEVSKQVADVRFTSLGVTDVQDAAARARARIFELERELEEISRQAMASQNKALKTAREMAFQASVEDEAIVAASSAKSRKLIMETRSKF